MKPKTPEFRREIAAALIVKIILIISLKVLFFSNPADRNLSGQDVDRLFFGAGRTAPASLVTPEDSCDDHRTDC